MRLNPIKLLTRSQSQMLRRSSPNKDEEKNLISFITKKRDNLISAKESTITPTSSRRKVKIILPKINNSMVNNQPILINKKETIDDILNKYKNSPNPENSKEINNNSSSIFDMMFKKNNLIKKNRIKLNKIVLKKHMSTIDEIKRRNREIRRRKEKQEREEFELRQREAKKLMASFKVELDGNNKMKRKVGKRYTLFKEILIYLESNNITLDQLAKNDPFQHQAYMLPNSYDFFNAIKYHNYDYVMQTLDSNPNYLFTIDYFGQTPYHWAAKLGDLKMTKILLDYGLYHNQKDYKGRTPLYIAAMNNNKDVCNYLLSKGANIFLKDKNGLGPADAAGSPEMKSFLLDFMSQPFSNPIYKARIKQFLNDREEKIERRNQLLEEQKRKEENAKLLNMNINNKEENKQSNNDGNKDKN
jgi:hypothetical protein